MRMVSFISRMLPKHPNLVLEADFEIDTLARTPLASAK
jgi:hypothetical protein